MIGTFTKVLVLLVGLVLFSRPAAAVEMSSFIYAVGDTGVAGGSITALDYDDTPYGPALWANVESTLWVGEDELDYEYAFDPTFAEDSVYGGGGSGTYTVLGDHGLLVYDYGWYYAGQTSASMDFSVGGGDGGEARPPAGR